MKYLQPRTIWLAITGVLFVQLLSGLHFEFHNGEVLIEYKGGNFGTLAQTAGIGIAAVLSAMNHGETKD